MTPIIEKIRKLLALSKSANPNEAATAAALAQKLMAQYRLEPHDVNDPVELTARDPKPLIVWASVRPPPVWLGMLGANLATLNGCACVIERTGYREWSVWIAGQRTDLEALRYLFAWLLAEVTRLTEKNFRAHMTPETYKAGLARYGRSFARDLKLSYRLGVVTGALDAMKKAEAEARAAAPGIVKVDTRLQEAGMILRAQFGEGREDNREVRVNRAAIEAGRAAGSHLHGSKPLGSGGTRMLGDGK